MVVGITYVSMIFFGVLLILSGVSHAADVFKYSHWKGALWQALIAAVYIFGGCLVIYDPFLVSTLITGLLAAMFIILGISRIIMAFVLKNADGFGWLILSGIVAFALGIMILMHWPVSGVWVIGLFIAIEMIVNGWTYILIAFSLRQKRKEI